MMLGIYRRTELRNRKKKQKFVTVAIEAELLEKLYLDTGLENCYI